jgi:hypothetical protein
MLTQNRILNSLDRENNLTDIGGGVFKPMTAKGYGG